MSHPFVAIPSYIHIYQGVGADQVNGSEIADYLKLILKRAKVDLRLEFFNFCLSFYSGEAKADILNETAVQMAKIKVRDVTKKDILSEPMPLEIEYEKKNLLKSTGRTFGILYEGFKLQQLYLKLINKEERDLQHLHFIITDQLFATWNHHNHRYHARTSIYGLPSLLSTSGIVEAPAKPRDFYLKRQLGEDPHLLKEEYQESFIDYSDPRMTDVLKGYVAQALFYHLAGYPFCEDKNCRLFNAHRQSELIHAQMLSPYEFCPTHQALLDQLEEVLSD